MTTYNIRDRAGLFRSGQVDTPDVKNSAISLAKLNQDIFDYIDTSISTAQGGYATETYVDTEVATKQNTLVSGTNIKTVNGNSILGSGDLVVSPIEQVVTTTTTSAELLDTFPSINYRSAEYFITTSSENGFSAFKLILVHDDTNVYYTTHSIVGNTNSGDITAEISTGDVNVYFTATNASTQIKFVRTTISGPVIAQLPLNLSQGSGTFDLELDFGTLDLDS
jgi:hypothetical protein